MIIKIMVWEVGDKQGNYVAAVKRKGTEEPVVGKELPTKRPDPKKDQGRSAKSMVGDDDIPF